MWYLELQAFIMPLLKDEDGANAVEYALIMALVAVFIIGAIILMAGEIANHFDSMADCLDKPAECTAELFGPKESL